MRRRQVLAIGAGAAAPVAAAVTGLDLVARGVLPGQQVLAQLDGACSVVQPPLSFGPPGPAISGRFHSRARQRQVGYTIAYPPGHRPGSRLPLVIALHGEGRDHDHVLSGMTLPQALALHLTMPGGGQRRLPPMAMAAGSATGIRIPATIRWAWSSAS
jgi:hypothetical protein